MILSLWILLFSFCQSLEMNRILKELSWPLKLKVLNELPGSQDKHYAKPPQVHPPKPSPSIVSKSSETLCHSTETAQPKYEQKENMITPGQESNTQNIQEGDAGIRRNENNNRRSVGIELLRKTNEDATPNEPNDDNDMRLKLFRLMYETVRDSDLKVKRAELIKDHYTNSSTFEIGYLVGDITDKANIITDISMTLKRFYTEWKPIEHINAYEQIANQAIEITHLIDLVRVVNKRDKDNSGLAGFAFK